MEKIDFLIDYLIKENKELSIYKIPKNINEKKNLYRGLCNIREAKPISKEYIKIENDYLQEILKHKKITKVENIEAVNQTINESNLKNKDKICLWQGDITTLEVEAVVNAANSKGLGCFIPCHKCIDNQLNSQAGIALRLECNEIMREKDYNLDTGKAFVTKGYNLPSKYVIHTVGPIIYDYVSNNDIKKLAYCYINSLKLAIENGIRTIAFPCISTGEFRFPKDKACEIAVSTVDEFLNSHRDFIDKVVFNVYSEEDYKIYEQIIRKN